jgi:outer membrane lipoprotein-sorting protein
MSRWLLALALGATTAAAQDARAIIAESVKRTESKSQRYEGTLAVTSARSKVSTKRWIYERLGAAGQSKAVIRFTEPAEVKGVALLIHNHPERASDQWMWTPTVQRERRIAFQDRRTRFFGTDFTFEDLEERDTDRATYRLLGEENVDGQACWKIESTPKAEARSQYVSSTIWVRKDIYAFVRIEAFGKEGLARKISYREFERVQGIWTARAVEVTDPKRQSTTTLRIEKLQYNLALPEENFTLQALRREG